LFAILEQKDQLFERASESVSVPEEPSAATFTHGKKPNNIMGKVSVLNKITF
jgi:hypothetical protein